ncbi:PREDICTED: protein FAM160B1-like [Amphimedon queenslandica]|uniref:FHF complex subunit HOOK-interacting protein C-terminal domain-containing protein n=1 Tax=Amphimedon queenslandica TaxID=400682 RepID=A0A1X7VLB6_AMPQE|nr:PREDICTED: protein FAM160B1-like [Amphimedon queenslandica]|eukprot:XP_019864392.1 PREDICTED: protein FAM160B1-like [Amphimedon queenslandica]
MFSRLTTFLAQAAEVTTQVLVGQQKKEEEFSGHWKTITGLISSAGESESDSCITEISTHLERMADLLFQEEEEEKTVSMGPCMEFVIRHKLLDTLCATAKSDFPEGMRKSVFHFLSLLLGRIQQPLIPHITVHRPLNTLIKTCGLSYVNPLAVVEVQFLRTLCLTLRNDETLSNFFLEESSDKGTTNFTVAEALMRISNCEDSLVCLKAFECLLECVPLQTVSPIMCRSQFPLLLASKMRQHLQLLPSSLDYTDILNCRGGWGVNYASSSAIHCLSPSPSQPLLHLEAYLSWLDYCEQVVTSAAEDLQDYICDCIREQVLESVVLPKLLTSSEIDLVMGLSLLSLNLLVTSHIKLTMTFIHFIMNHSLDKLISSCNHLSEEVSCSSFLLLGTLFQRPTGLPYHLLSTNQSPSTLLNKEYIRNTVSSYLSIVPSHLLTAQEVTGDSGITYYMIEAHQQVSTCYQLVNDWEGKPESVQNNEVKEDEIEREEAKEHPLITALLDRLERLLDQTYELNLHLTTVISILAAYPQLESLFVTTETGSSAHRNVYTVLQKVSSQLQDHAERNPTLQLNIVEARRRLAGQETSDLLSMPNNELLEGAVLLEELCKEIAANLYVRHSTSLISGQAVL